VTLHVLRPGGRAAFIGGPPLTPTRGDVRALKPPVSRSTKAMNLLAELIDAGAVRPPEFQVHGLPGAAEAHRISKSRHLRGKLVFRTR
jgi:NADPH:quinone reductase-like Zn-dependent oxidoreductase